MPTQASILLPDEVFAELTRRARRQDDRSSLVAEALLYFFETHPTADDELKKINRHADELNQEAQDVLDYQVLR